MPSVHSLPPERARILLEGIGYHVAEETEYNWVFKKKEGPAHEPVLIPRKCKLLPLEIANELARRVVGIGRYMSAVADYWSSCQD